MAGGVVRSSYLVFFACLLCLSSLFSLAFSACLLIVRGVSSLAAPALVLLLFALPPSDPLDFLTSAPVAFAILVLALAAIADFCADLWRLRTAQKDERRFLSSTFLASTLLGAGSAVEGLIRLERTARWKLFRRRGEWLFVPLWLVAAWWIHDEAAVPMVAGAMLGVLWLLFFGWLASWDGERREHRIADGALRAAASLGLARLLGRFADFAERSLARHRRARRAEQSLALLSAVCLLGLRLSAAATLVLFLLYALSLVGLGRVNFGELVAILLLLRALFFWLEQRARALSFYAPQKRRGRLLTFVSATEVVTPPNPERTDAEGEAGADTGAETSVANILQVEQGEVLSRLACDALVLRQGEAVALAGESASGKSLFLQACVGLVESKGFRLSGESLHLHAPHAYAPSLRGVGYVPQEATLLDGSLGENIASFRAPCDEARATELLVLLGAERTLARLPERLATRTDPFDATLPQAFRVQVLLAAALYFEPRLLLCDASIDALDGKGIERFARVLQNFCKKGAAVVATRQSALLRVCRRAWICANNRVQVREFEASQSHSDERE